MEHVKIVNHTKGNKVKRERNVALIHVMRDKNYSKMENVLTVMILPEQMRCWERNAFHMFVMKDKCC